MFAELIEWLTTPCPSTARRLGYLREAIAIRARHRRHRENWRPHLDATRAFVERAAAIPPRKRTAVLLGSGAPLDVPIDALAAVYEKAELVDIVHLRAARHAAARLDNVILRTEDISGAIAPLIDLQRNATAPPQLAPLPQLTAETDFVLSANLLSQLPDLPYNRLGKHSALSEAARRTFSAEIVQRHLDWLAQLDCRVALVTDIERCYVERDGRSQEPWNSLYGAELPSGGDHWFWDIADLGEMHSQWRHPDAYAC